MDKKYTGGGVFQTRLLAVIRDVSECICNFHRSEQDVLSDVIKIIENKLGIYSTKIILAGQDGNDIIAACCDDVISLGSDGQGKCHGYGVSRKVRLSGKPEVVKKFADNPTYAKCRRLVNLSSDSSDSVLICVPIIYNGQCIGTLGTMVNSDSNSDYTYEVNGLSIIAGLIANIVSTKRKCLLERETLQHENNHLRALLNMPGGKSAIIGESSAMKAVLNKVRQVADYNTTILLLGESGTGKELIAEAIHYQSKRSDMPLVKLNCSTINTTLFESEIFGHVKGAFTGAESDHEGYIAKAQGGTLFFDEIADFSPEVQIKLLRFLQERNYQPVGSSQTRNADIRLIVASRMDLAKLVQTGKFREDLWYRINGFAINIPPLSERTEDIIPMANYYLRKYSQISGKQIAGIAQPVIYAMLNYKWPGNIRELQNWMEYAVLTCQTNRIEISDLPVPQLQEMAQTKKSLPISLQNRMEIIEQEIVSCALSSNGNHIETAAKELGISPRMLNYKIKKWKLDIKRPPRKRS